MVVIDYENASSLSKYLEEETVEERFSVGRIHDQRDEVADFLVFFKFYPFVDLHKLFSSGDMMRVIKMSVKPLKNFKT